MSKLQVVKSAESDRNLWGCCRCFRRRAFRSSGEGSVQKLLMLPGGPLRTSGKCEPSGIDRKSQRFLISCKLVI